MTLGLATRLLTIAIGIKTTAIGIAWYLNPAVNRRRARGALPQAPLSVLQPAELEGERGAAVEKDPGHVAIGEEGNSNADAEGTQQSAQLAAQDSEASSAVPTTTTMHASNAPVHAPLGFGSTHLLELPEELLLRVLARLTAGLPLSLPLKDDSRQAPQSSEGFIAAPTFQGARQGMCFKKGPAGRSCLPDFARVTFCDVLAQFSSVQFMLAKNLGKPTRLVYRDFGPASAGEAHILAPVGVCCKAFANIVPEAAAVFVRQEFARHTKGWTEQPSWACQLRDYYTSPMQEYLRKYYIPDLSVKREAEAKAQVEAILCRREAEAKAEANVLLGPGVIVRIRPGSLNFLREFEGRQGVIVAQLASSGRWRVQMVGEVAAARDLRSFHPWCLEIKDEQGKWQLATEPFVREPGQARLRRNAAAGGGGEQMRGGEGEEQRAIARGRFIIGACSYRCMLYGIPPPPPPVARRHLRL